MALNLASPGIVVREVDLTIGRVDATSGSIGALVAPFAKGPVGTPVLITDEADLLNNFGQPYETDKHYEDWLVASSYLAYGGNMRVVRADDTHMKNAFTGSASDIKIKSTDHYNQLGYDNNTITGVTFSTRNPGSWGNGIRVATIDGLADQIVGINTAGIGFGTAGTPAPSGMIGLGVTQTVPNNTILVGAGSTSILDGFLKGIITQELGNDKFGVKVVSHVSVAGTETAVDYTESGIYRFKTGFDVAGLSTSSTGSIGIITATSGTNTTIGYAGTIASAIDWFGEQTLTLTGAGSTITWNSIVDKPGTSSYAAARNARFDEIHVIVIDGKGEVTGNAGTILEKHISLSKAKDAEYSVGSTAYWRKYLYNTSTQVFGGSAPAGVVATNFSSGFTAATDIGWDQDAEGISFAGSGSNTYALDGGKNYDGGTDLSSTGALTSTLGEISTGYELFENTENFEVDFLLMGSGAGTKSTIQAKANKIIAVAELRKDAIAFISPSRNTFISDGAVGTVTVNNDSAITNSVVDFYSPITSTTYGVFDSGYKYMYDRFSDTFRYVPLNGDIAGTCARNDLTQFPWFSPAGNSRGAILNAVKLAYNPSKAQRDKLYTNRVNPVIFQPGDGIILFGDKTGFGKSSAFDRINVRRLFIFLEDAISAAARDQLFEFNDEITRTNFVNIVEPFLRDVQAKRGIFDYVVICDETNNTASVIDNNEFVADIFIKPARSINFIGLTFVATRTGVSFEEVIGNV
jgi:hypothetical protein